ncbi:MAG: hypothetical protein CBD77_04365 [bacterium TMED217]|nr:MAG: hypothetical protein CBD77_04365 [bacterium TMED217]
MAIDKLLNLLVMLYSQYKIILIATALSFFFSGPIIAEESSDMVGKKAAPLSLFKLSNNKYYRTKDIIGEKNIVISFFGTWCAPCRKEIPKLQEMSKELNKDAYEFLLICVSNIKPPGSTTAFKEEVPNIKKFIKKLGVDIEVLFDKYNVAWRKYADLNQGTFPLTVVINKKGEITYHHHGYEKGDEIKLKKHLKTL